MNKWKSLCVYTVCAAMTLSLAGCGQSSTTSSTATDEATSKKLEQTLEEKANVKAGSGEFDKEETVYLMADATGAVNETIVSEWLKNQERTQELKDSSDLKDIKNVKGDEKFTQTGSNLTWDAAGADIYYQGTTTKEAPVAVKVSYYLDDKEVSAKEIAGKSGKVKIKFTYTNKDKQGDVYTPFVMMTGMVLSNENFSNIEVDNGKVISDGTNNIVVGYGLPGLKDSLDLSIGDEDLDVDVPDSFEVTADAKDFKLDMTMTIATSQLFDDVDTDDMDLSDVFDKLDDKLDEFKTGSSDLSKGVKKYTDGVGDVADGTKTLKNGTATLASSTKTLKNATASIKSGSDTLNSGASTLDTGIGTAKSGADQLVAGYEGEKGAVAGAKALADGLSKLNTAVQALTLPTAAIPETTPEQQAQIAQLITQQLTQLIPTEVASYAQNDPTILSDEHVLNAYKAAYQTAYAKAYAAGMKDGAQAAVDKVNTVVGGMSGQITTLKSSVTQLATGSAALSEGVGKLYAGTSSLQAGLGELKTGSEKLSKGTSSLKTGSKKLDSGAKKLNKGVATLNSGALKLYKGAKKLDSNSSALLSGTKKLLKGVDKIVDKADDYESDATTLTDRAKALINAGKEYTSFAGTNEDSKSSCKFIIKTEKVEK